MGAWQQAWNRRVLFPDWKPDVDSTHIGDEQVMATSAQVQQLYIALLGRAADKPGLDWWLENINGGERTLEQAAAAFTTSEEYISVYGDLQGDALVTAVYSNLFERTPSAEEVAYWVNDGRPADQLLAAFLAYASPADQTVINNKVFVAQAYSNATGDDYNLDAAAQIIANVDGTAASVSAALNNLPTSTATLTEGIVAYQDAVAAEAAALAEIALADNANQNDGDAVVVDLASTANIDELEDFVDQYSAADARTELTRAESEVGADEVALLDFQSDLREARNVVESDPTGITGDYLNGVRQTDANLRAALSEVRADIAATAGATSPATDFSALLNLRSTAEAQLATDVNTDGNNAAVLAEVRDAIVAFAAAGGDVTASAGTSGSVAELLAEIGAALTADDNGVAVDTLIATFDGVKVDVSAVTTPTAEAATLASAVTTAEQRATLEKSVETAEANLVAAGGLGADLVAIENMIEARDELIQDVTDAEAELTESQQYFAELTELMEAYVAAGKDIDNAREALNKIGVENIVELGVQSTAGTASEGDLYLFIQDETKTISLLNFEADDRLFIGEGFARVDLAADASLSTERLGDSSALEVFFQQVGANTVVSVEGESFGGNALNLTDMTTITLTGVSVENVTFENGYVTVA